MAIVTVTVLRGVVDRVKQGSMSNFTMVASIVTMADVMKTAGRERKARERTQTDSDRRHQGPGLHAG